MKTNVYPCKPQFYYTKVGFKGVKIIYACFCDDFVEKKYGSHESLKVEQISFFSSLKAILRTDINVKPKI